MENHGGDKRRLIMDGVGRMMDWNKNLYPFPRKCFCNPTSYQQLEEEEDDYTKLERVELYFYANIKDNIYRKVTVERNLVVADLCQILIAKFGYRRGVDYAIYEYWVDLGVERVVEDHEDILKAYIDQKLFNPNAKFKFVFTRDTQRYAMYQHPEVWNRSFLQNPVLIESDDDNSPPRRYPVELIQERDEFNPIVATRLYHHDEKDDRWYPEDGWVLLRQGVIYAVADQVILQDLATVSMSDFRRKVADHLRGGLGAVAAVARARDHHAYQTAGRRDGAGADGHALVLRPDRTPPARRSRAPESAAATAVATAPPTPDADVRRIGCAVARHRLSWVAAMRLAKYGKQLRENYKAFRSKKDQEPPNSPADDFISYAVSHVNSDFILRHHVSERQAKAIEEARNMAEMDSVRSRVAMDFTGARGRIVSDPAEAAAVAAGGGAPDAPADWRRRWRAAGARRAALLRAAEASAGGAGATAASAHALQPWFHGGVTRERAGHLVIKYGEGHPDGVFLVRESNSHPGTFVITYKYKSKAHHVPIVPAIDEDTDQLVYTLDKGGTRFYDLLQLVEFYQLNSGCLNTKLKRYVVQQKRLDEIEAAKMVAKTQDDIVAEGSSSPESDPFTTSALSTLNSSRRSL